MSRSIRKEKKKQEQRNWGEKKEIRDHESKHATVTAGHLWHKVTFSVEGEESSVEKSAAI